MTGPFTGSQEGVTIGAETDGSGVLVPANLVFVPYQLEVAEDKVTEGLEGNFMNRNEHDSQYEMSRVASPVLTGVMDFELIGHVLKGLLTPTVVTNLDDPEAGVNTHVFTMNNTNIPPTLSIVKENPISTAGKQRALLYAVVDSFNLNWTPQGFTKFTANLKSRFGIEVAESITPTNFKPFQPKFAQYKQADNLAGLDIAPALRVSEFSFDINNNIDEKFDAFDVFLPRFFWKLFSGTASVKFLYEDLTFRDLFETGTKKAHRFEFIDTSTTIGLVSNPTLRFDFDSSPLLERDQSKSRSDLGDETYALKFGRSTVANGSPVTITLINEVTSY